ncbi:MAG: mandelate racemase/muconate lactonizing enzyme family protein [Alphaproteobacteria bacterium]|jgi:L-alanine-DL-glutamate epimerase-like enolase superfamily enzyme|nr:mandelate racemase/muconate lactonizing enzyme family protein [Alphaproteobacteria bacterium]
MRIVEIREQTVPIKSEIANAAIDFSQMTASVLALVTDVVRDGKPVVGFGFNSNGRYAQGGILRERVIPRVMAAAPESLLDESGSNLAPAKVWAAAMANEKPGGHGDRSVAVGVLDMAVWDAVAKVAEKPLHRLLAERYNDGRFDERVFVYAAGGYYGPGKDETALQNEMQGYLAQGYDTVKMKIGAAPIDEDKRRIEAVLEVVGSGDRLAVDANGRFDLETALAYAEMMAPYGLRWFEEPGDPLDFALQAELSKVYAPAMSTAENLFSHQDARNLARYAGMRPERDILQFDPVLAYGLVEYLRILETMADFGWPYGQHIPHGGHQFALEIAAGLGLGGNESYPGVFQPFGGFADELAVEDGHVAPSALPGIGYEGKANLYAVLRTLVED